MIYRLEDDVNFDEIKITMSKGRHPDNRSVEAEYVKQVLEHYPSVRKLLLTVATILDEADRDEETGLGDLFTNDLHKQINEAIEKAPLTWP